MRDLIRPLSVLAFVLSLPTAAVAEDAKPFSYPAGKYGKGELKYVGKVPVLVVEGTPAEMGEQIGELAARHAARHPKPMLYDFPRDYFRYELAAEIRRQDHKLTVAAANFAALIAEPGMWGKFQKVAGDLKPNFPKDQLAELEAIIKAGGLDAKHLIASNGMFDLGHAAEQLMAGCSSVIVPSNRSATGGVLFGRNLDYFHFGYLHQYSLLMVYRPSDRKKRRFVSAGFPGLVGSFTGMNDAGLTIASHDVLEPVTTTKFNPKGEPFAMTYRRVLEECETVGDALKLLDGIERASITSLVIADPTGGAVIEVTPDSLAIRRFKDKPGVCTNHFCTAANPKQQDLFATTTRFKDLEKSVAVKGDEKFGVRNVRDRLHDARLIDENKDDLTIQTFVFEPAKRTVHLRFGDGTGPATKGDLITLDLNALWGK